MLLPSAFTVQTGRDHWEVLLRARAIETQSSCFVPQYSVESFPASGSSPLDTHGLTGYVIAAAQVGKHNEKRKSWGQSMVVDPWGRVLSRCRSADAWFSSSDSDDGLGEREIVVKGDGFCGPEAELLYATIDPDTISDVRSRMPVFEHRVPALYHA